MLKNFFQSKLVTLSAASILAAIPVLVGAPAQAQMGVGVDGRLEEYGAYSAPLLGMGVTGSAVEDLQIFLDEIGYYYGPIDGEYDTEFMSAVEDFQSDYGLMSDGIVGPNTWGLLSGIDSESIYESEDSYDAATGLYTDYEDGMDYSYEEDETAFGDGGLLDDEGAF